MIAKNKIEKINSETEKWLKEYYKSDIELLEKLISIDLEK